MQSQLNNSKRSIYFFVGTIAIIVIAITGALAFRQNQNSISAKGSSSNASSSAISTNIMSKESAMVDNSDHMAKGDSGDKMVKTDQKPGIYTNYSENLLAKAGTGEVVLFFNASWCPTCQATVKDINANLNNIPSNLTILSTDYDKETALKQKYGITYQHTFVKVDPNGNLIKKASGLETLDAISEFAKS